MNSGRNLKSHIGSATLIVVTLMTLKAESMNAWRSLMVYEKAWLKIANG
jgi:hypothetical protein